MEVFAVYAVVESGSKQYKVSVGQTIEVEKLPVEPGGNVTLDRVVLLAEGDEVTVGKPTIDGASVAATVVQHGLRKKVIIFRFRPKQRYRVKRGFRQPYTRLHIDEIKA
jgi:large subunit ribosomal protein L21